MLNVSSPDWQVESNQSRRLAIPHRHNLHTSCRRKFDDYIDCRNRVSRVNAVGSHCRRRNKLCVGGIIGLGWWLLFGVLFSVAPRAVGQQLPPTPTTGPALSLTPSPTYPQTAIPKADRLPTAAAPPAVNPPPAAQPTAPAERPTVTRILQGVPQPFVGQARPPIGFLRRPSDANTMAAMPPRPTFTGRSIGTSQPQVKQKPFSHVGYAPTISPYLQLGRDDVG